MMGRRKPHARSSTTGMEATARVATKQALRPLLVRAKRAQAAGAWCPFLGPLSMPVVTGDASVSLPLSWLLGFDVQKVGVVVTLGNLLVVEKKSAACPWWSCVVPPLIDEQWFCASNCRLRLVRVGFTLPGGRYGISACSRKVWCIGRKPCSVLAMMTLLEGVVEVHRWPTLYSPGENRDLAC